MPLTKSQFAPYELYDNQTLESFVRGLTTQKSEELDSAFSPELTQHLFQQEDESLYDWMKRKQQIGDIGAAAEDIEGGDDQVLKYNN